MPAPTAYTFADWQVGPSARELLRNGRAAALEPRVFDLLCHLLAHRDRVVPKQELLDVVWHGADVSEAVIHRAAVKLRAALGDTQRPPQQVRTVHRVRCRFVALADDAGDDITAPPAAPGRRKTWRGSTCCGSGPSARRPRPRPPRWRRCRPGSHAHPKG